MMEKWLLPPADYARVHEARSESEALLVQRILHDAGIPAVVRSRQVPGDAEVIRRAIGVWGDVLVPVEHRTDARRYVDDYLRAMKEAGPVSRFAGIIPPIVTLFDERGRIDEGANARHIEFLLRGGVHGIFALGSTMPPALVAKLAEAYANVLGIKETVDSIGHIHEVLARVKPLRPEFSVLCGYEFHLLSTLQSGGDGAIPALANFAPQLPVQIYERFKQGQLAEAAELLRGRLELAALYQLDAPFFVVVKEAMAMLDLIPHATVRRPAGPLTAESRARLRELLTAAGVL